MTLLGLESVDLKVLDTCNTLPQAHRVKSMLVESQVELDNTMNWFRQLQFVFIYGEEVGTHQRQIEDKTGPVQGWRLVRFGFRDFNVCDTGNRAVITNS